MNALQLIMKWGPGSFLGIIVGLVVCGIIAFVGIKISKKEGVKIDAVLAGLNDEEISAVKSQTFTPTDKKNMFNSYGYVVSVLENGEKVQATLLFYMEEHDSFYTRVAKVDEATAVSKGIKQGAFVPVSMKYDAEMHYYDYKGLL
ncbi:MAG: hypothetical protein J5840_08580 [Lachnospiraceae bacterium]|nr:hypothetical protein [Lachnospiraceae bacterium]